jgi:SAM-dependent methyltransferase
MRGLRQILRFNWPFYAAGLLVVITAAAVAARAPIPFWTRTVCAGGAAVVVFWMVSSLAASWIVYDRSPLMRWTWIPRAIGFVPRRWVNIHAGLDESTPALRSMFESDGRAFDFFDPAETTEASIARARRQAINAVRPEPIDVHHLPAASGTVDAALLLLSAHELRSDAARGALFGELSRILTTGGRIVVAEHLRDWANVLAFGPGALHFHSRRTWRRAFDRARLAVDREFSITPFVRVFVLRASR